MLESWDASDLSDRMECRDSVASNLWAVALRDAEDVGDPDTCGASASAGAGAATAADVREPGENPGCRSTPDDADDGTAWLGDTIARLSGDGSSDGRVSFRPPPLGGDRDVLKDTGWAGARAAALKAVDCCLRDARALADAAAARGVNGPEEALPGLAWPPPALRVLGPLDTPMVMTRRPGDLCVGGIDGGDAVW